MSNSEYPVFLSPSSDPEMQAASERARDSFRYFWREIAWERRRIIPALDMAAIKAPFTDGIQAQPSGDDPSVEEMWMSDIDFNGETVGGTLLNSPNWLKTVKAGDTARFPLFEITDWMYVIGGEVFGAYTVNLLRSRMDRQERQDHDTAWGLNFGDPKHIRVAPEPKKGGGLLKNWFGGKPDSGEHPMSVNMATKLKEQIVENPSLLSSMDDRGWTLLHQEALAGSAPTVKVLLEAGADLKARTNQGKTPLQLAEALGWEKVVELLRGR